MGFVASVVISNGYSVVTDLCDCAVAVLASIISVVKMSKDLCFMW